MKPFVLLWLFRTVPAPPWGSAAGDLMIRDNLALCRRRSARSRACRRCSPRGGAGLDPHREGSAHSRAAGGTVLTALGSALRAAPDAALLRDLAMGVGIAIMQPSLPSVVREWVPQRIALGTAVYSNGLLMGEALAASLTIPLVLPAVGNDWRLALVAWSVPVLAIAVAGAWYQKDRPREPVHAKAKVWWPDWRSPITWRLGIISGGCSSIYFTTNAFLPDLLRGLGRAELLNAAGATPE
jgi:CP family cyanate transporter-like MFS transporter